MPSNTSGSTNTTTTSPTTTPSSTATTPSDTSGSTNTANTSTTGPSSTTTPGNTSGSTATTGTSTTEPSKSTTTTPSDSSGSTGSTSPSSSGSTTAPSTTTPPANPSFPTPAPLGAPAQRSSFESSEYRLSNGAIAAGAVGAYEQGATGAGVKIGIVDSGIDTGFADFAGRIDAASRDAAGSRALSDEAGHGTAVGAIAAAARNGQYQHGVAYGATIVAARADTPSSCATAGGCAFGDAALAAGVDLARAAGARVINLSVAGDGAGAKLVAAVDAATRAGVIVVVAAGNGGATAAGGQPEGFATGLAQLAGNGLVIIAGSVGVADANAPGGVDLSRISTFSNRAGSSSGTYLTTLGHQLIAPNVQDGYKPYYWTGTSFSAPVISGAVALLAQRFPHLTGQQIVSLLYKTADDLGAAGADGVFGQGRLNIDRAFQPVGATSLAGSGAPVSLVANGQLPAASGDARPAGASAVILDEFARPFRLDVGATMANARRDDARLARALGQDVSERAAAAGGVSLAMSVAERNGGAAPVALDLGADGARDSRLLAGRALARLDDRTAVALGFAEGAKGLERELAGANGGGSFVQASDPLAAEAFALSRGTSFALRRELGGVALTASSETGRAIGGKADARGGYRLTGVTAEGRAAGFSIAVGASRISEAETVLGGRLAPSLATAGASTRFLDVEVSRELGAGWSGKLLHRRGWTAFAGDDGRLATGAWAAEFAKTGALTTGDRLGVRLSQPLRVSGGGLTTALPDSYDWRTGDVTVAPSTMSFVPRGRELAGEASYGIALPGGSLTANAFLRRQPGHQLEAGNDAGAAIRLGLAF